MRFIILFLFFPFFLCCEQNSWTVSSEGFTAQSEISKTNITSFEDVAINLFLTYPKGFHVDEEALKNHLMRHSLLKPPPFVLKNVESDSSDTSENKVFHKLSYVLHPQYTGSFSLTFLEISFIPIDQSEAPVTLISDIFEVSVTLPKTTAASPFHPASLLPLSLSLPIEIDKMNRQELTENSSRNQMEAQRNMNLLQKKTFPWIEWFILLMLALFWISLRFFPLKPFTIFEKREQRIEKARKKTRQAIAMLQKDNSALSNRYQKLSSLFKNYLEIALRFKFKANTTPEMLKNLSLGSELSPQEYESLSRLLLKSDLVKFAQYNPSREEFEEDIKNAEQFIDHKM